MHGSRTISLVLFAAIAGLAVTCPAQTTRPATADSAFRRAHSLASEGNTGAARSITDSVLAASVDGTVSYAEALFWRATYTESADQARRDYLRIAVEFPLSPRAEDALLRLSQLELALGDRVSAKRHLGRLENEYPNGHLRAQGSYWMGRLLLDDGNLPQACVSLTEAKQRAATTDVELANLVSYYSRQCAARQEQPDTTTADLVLNKNTIVGKGEGRRADGATRKAPVLWSAQVAAFDAAGDALALAQRLARRGFDARVTADRPFRVRIGQYATRRDAQVLVEKLRRQKMTALLVEAERP